jgi:hypothetical protein
LVKVVHVELQVSVSLATHGAPTTDVIVNVTEVPGEATGIEILDGDGIYPVTKGPPAIE